MVVHLLQNLVEKKFFFFFTKYTLFAGKMFLYGKKRFILKFFLTGNNFKYKWKCENMYLTWELNFYAENVVLQLKYKSFLTIYSLSKKNFFDHKKYIC